MKTKSCLLTFLLFLALITNPVSAQKDALLQGLNTITKESVQAQLEFLSSDWMEGRATGEKGEFIAGDYLASMLMYNGIHPAGDEEWTTPTREQRWNGIHPEKHRDYYQNIYMTRYLGNETQLSIVRDKSNKILSFNENVDFSISDYPVNIKTEASLVFVGYGFVDEKSGYDDFKGIDVKDKVIVRLSGFPGHLDTLSAGYKKYNKDKKYFNYYLQKEKNKIAAEKGALAIIEISDVNYAKYWAKEKDFEKVSENKNPRSPIYKYKLELPLDKLKGEPFQIYPTQKLASQILENQGINIEKFEKNVAKELKPHSKNLKGIKINLNYKVNTDIIQTRNVLGVIEGENKDEIVVIGAHYDHLGTAGGFVWNGADDNASGTIGVWMLAKAFAASGIKPKKTIVFAAWTGEEKGLLGSEYFADNPYGGDINKVKFYLNFDMISKDSENDTLKNQARMTYTSSLTELEELTRKNIEEYHLNLDLSYSPSEKPRGGSDHTSFSNKYIPIMYFMAGFPITYHTPEDQTYDVNWNKMVDIIKLGYLNLWEIINEE